MLWGGRVDLHRNGQIDQFATDAAPAQGWCEPRAAVTYILTDKAHNRTTTTVELSDRAEEVYYTGEDRPLQDAGADNLHNRKGACVMTAAAEIEYGVIAAIIILAIVLIVIAARRKPRNAYGKLWAPLIPLVNGTAQGSRLLGTYGGMPVAARIAGAGEENPAYHYELTMTAGSAAGDWSLAYTGEKFLGTGAKTWRVKSKDGDLAPRLTEAGAVAAIQQWADQPEISYKAKSGTLHYWQRVDGMRDVPTPEAFQAQLDLLAQLAQINQQANRE